MKESEKTLRKYLPYLLSALVFALFFFMSRSTPLAGDDWGYAINGMKQNPLLTAFEFYRNWSGRFFSELWGFIVAPRKWLWNLLNPLFFTLIYFFSYRIAQKRRENGILIALVLLAMMLNVNSELRMQTYTWIMGTTYVIPLVLSLIYFALVLPHFDSVDQLKRGMQIFLFALLFYIGLTMENIAAIMVFGELLLLGYYYLEHRKISSFFVISLFVSLLAFVLMRLSPGSTYRLLRDHAEFNALPLIEKIRVNLPYFVQYTFTKNKFILFFFIVALVGEMLFEGGKIDALKVILGIYLGWMLLLLFYENLASRLPLALLAKLTDPFDSAGLIFWIGLIVVAFVIVIVYVKDTRTKLLILFFITLGGSSNLIMMVSPIFGARSALYYVYFMIVATLLLYNRYAEKTKYAVYGVVLIALALSALRVREFYFKYSQVAAVEAERQSIIAYYREHPEIKEIHIPRMPIYSIHSADVEEGDDYHFETFKQYYGLVQDAKVIFDWKESY